MEIKEIEINKIKPDNNQPRRSHPEPGIIEQMAQTIKAHGLINAIEVDDNLVVVTGHIRLEAAKKAGLKKVPCIVINPANEQIRFQRQMIENIYHNQMHDMDIANGLYKILSLFAPGASKKGSGGHNNKGITYTAKTIGKSEAYVREKLDLLDQSSKMQKAIKGGLPSSYARALKDLPKDFKERMETKIVAEEFKTKEIALAVKNALTQYPNQGIEIMNIDYTGLDGSEVNAKITNIIPDYSPTPVSDALEKAFEPSKKICDAGGEINRLLQTYSVVDVGGFNIMRVVLMLRSIQRNIAKWLGQTKDQIADVQPKLPEGESDEK